jgi:hypothetical protein
MQHLILAFILGLASLFPAAHPAAAQSPEVTASDVVDAETLMNFVEAAKEWSATFTDPNDFPSYIAAISTEGDWKHGNTYLILMLPNGTVIYHTDDPTVNGKSLYEAEDARGNKVVQQLLAQPRWAATSSITGTIRSRRGTKRPRRSPTPPAIPPGQRLPRWS